MRSSEWLLFIYFAYVAAISPFFPRTSYQPLLVFGLVSMVLWVSAREFVSFARDWVPIGLTLVAYREMNLFTPLTRDYHLEMSWIQWDRQLLYNAGFQRAIESLDSIGPGFLELCYLIVYAVGPFAVGLLYFLKERTWINRVLFLYLLGTLLAYALFPYFPSDPPRTVFSGADLPNVQTVLRRFNLWIVGGYGIHSSVFPSAHVSSAFSAAWALLIYLPGQRRFGWGMLIYAVSVAVATVYGRYHYAADALAGFGISLIAAAAVLLPRFIRARPV